MQIPRGVRVVRVVTAAEMLEAVKAALPADIAIFAAAVADWRVAAPSASKIKKSSAGRAAGADARRKSRHPENDRAAAKNRPPIVIGFAAETQDVLAHAKKKLKSKGADWIVANDVSPATGVMGGDRNTVHLLTSSGVESWPEMSKADVARKIIERAAEQLAAKRAAAE